MKKIIPHGIILIAMIIMTILFQRIPGWSRYYADSIYPVIRKILRTVSYIVPFSLYDLLIVVLIILLLTAIGFLFIRKTRKTAFIAILFGSGWLYVVFYFCWGINYFAPAFLARNNLQVPTYVQEQFDRFIDEYIPALNASYCEVPSYTPQEMQRLIGSGIDQVSNHWNFPQAAPDHKIREMLFGRLYASMGIRGYYGPFTAEAHVNPYYLPHEYPAVTIHELGHLAGITSEAEANLYAYLIATSSADPGFRFSGYYSILPYVLSNARRTMTENEYQELVNRIDPRIRELFKTARLHWDSLYSEKLGSIQDFFYEFYLKQNNIPSGSKNYSEVIGLLIAIDNLSLPADYSK